MAYTSKEAMAADLGAGYLGKVIRIIDEKTLIIDVGDDYLSTGDKVIIYRTADELVDLCGNSLGAFEIIKAVLDIVETTPRYSVCKKIVAGESPLSVAVKASFTTMKPSFAYLNIDKNDIQPLKEVPNSNVIKIGDYVRKS